VQGKKGGVGRTKQPNEDFLHANLLREREKNCPPGTKFKKSSLKERLEVGVTE